MLARICEWLVVKTTAGWMDRLIAGAEDRRIVVMVADHQKVAEVRRTDPVMRDRRTVADQQIVWAEDRQIAEEDRRRRRGATDRECIGRRLRATMNEAAGGQLGVGPISAVVAGRRNWLVMISDAGRAEIFVVDPATILPAVGEILAVGQRELGDPLGRVEEDLHAALHNGRAAEDPVVGPNGRVVAVGAARRNGRTVAVEANLSGREVEAE